MTRERVLIVAEAEEERNRLATVIREHGYDAETACSEVEALDRVSSWNPAIVVSSLHLPQLENPPAGPMIVTILSAVEREQAAAAAIAQGAFDFLEKPVNPVRLKNVLHNARRMQESERELAAMRRKLIDLGVFGKLTGSSRRMQDLFRLIELVAPSSASVLITGESGTGKELVARTIHSLSSRKAGPFVSINCAGVPARLIESELFGHDEGAFSGAMGLHRGTFELAEGGTLLLDEIVEMPIATQAMLLPVLRDRKLRRLGSKNETPLDVRVVASTRMKPEEAVARGKLRNDLFYRLNVFSIQIPPLREHKEDLPDLVRSQLRSLNEKYGRKVGAASDAVMAAFAVHSWPGNVRELRNTLERAIIVCEGAVIEPKHLPPGFGQIASMSASLQESNAVHLNVGTTVAEAERLLILKTLETTHNNKTRAADILGISLKTLHNKLKEYSSQQTDQTPDITEAAS